MEQKHSIAQPFFCNHSEFFSIFFELKGEGEIPRDPRLLPEIDLNFLENKFPRNQTFDQPKLTYNRLQNET